MRRSPRRRLTDRKRIAEWSHIVPSALSPHGVHANLGLASQANAFRAFGTLKFMPSALGYSCLGRGASGDEQTLICQLL